MNHHPTSRYRRAVIAAAITVTLLAACGTTAQTVPTELAPQADPTAEDRTDQPAGDADHQTPTGPSDQPTRPANGPHPF
jgi:hypothetical protein